MFLGLICEKPLSSHCCSYTYNRLRAYLVLSKSFLRETQWRKFSRGIPLMMIWKKILESSLFSSRDAMIGIEFLRFETTVDPYVFRGKFDLLCVRACAVYIRELWFRRVRERAKFLSSEFLERISQQIRSSSDKKTRACRCHYPRTRIIAHTFKRPTWQVHRVSLGSSSEIYIYIETHLRFNVNRFFRNVNYPKLSGK